MTDLAPLEVVYDGAQGDDLPLPTRLASLYGRLRFPPRTGRPYAIGNFVTTLDGVVSLGSPGHQAGGDISGFNEHDRMVMGLLRAVSDVVVVGAGTLRSVPGHLWTAEYVYPPLAGEYGQLRASLGKPGPPLNVIVSASGELDPEFRVLRGGEVPVLVVTTERGAQRMHKQSPPPSVSITAVAREGPVRAAAVLDAAGHAHQSSVVLVEGGPRLVGDFLAEGRLDELFLTLAPQIAGRDGITERPGLVSGRSFAPENPLWGTLVAVRRGESHLFLRYSFPSSPAPA
jgi:riboflavin biosynthesis pyrimidine reductase